MMEWLLQSMRGPPCDRETYRTCVRQGLGFWVLGLGFIKSGTRCHDSGFWSVRRFIRTPKEGGNGGRPNSGLEARDVMAPFRPYSLNPKP